jgi:hypothetical protein
VTAGGYEHGAEEQSQAWHGKGQRGGVLRGWKGWDVVNSHCQGGELEAWQVMYGEQEEVEGVSRFVGWGVHSKGVCFLRSRGWMGDKESEGAQLS